MKEKKTAAGDSSRPRAKRRIGKSPQVKNDYVLNENRFRALIEHSADAISLIAEDGEMFYVSPSASRISGYTAEERVGVNLFTLIHPDDLLYARQTFKELLTKPGASEFVHARLPRKDGAWMWIEGTATNLFGNPNVQAIVVNYRDATERVRAEAEARLLQSVTQAISDAPDFHAALQAVLQNVCAATGWDFGEVWIPRADGEALELNAGWCCKEKSTARFRKASEDYSFKLGEGLPGRVWATKQPEWVPDTSVNGQVFLRAQIAQDEGFHAGVCLPVLAEDQVFAVLGFFVFDSRAIDERWIQIISAVTMQLGMALKRKRAEEMLREREELLRNVLETLPIGVWITDGKGRIVHGNAAGQKIWVGAKYVGVEQYGDYKGWWLESGKRIEAEEWALARAVTRGETSVNEEIEIECFDGTRKIILNSAVPIRDAHGAISGAIVVNEDITERKHAEAELRLLHTVTQAIYEAPDFDSALRAMLMKVCEVTGWDFGEAWIPRADGSALELSPIWFASHDELKKFRESSESYYFSPGKGLPGRVWANKQPEWLPDMTLGGEIFLRSSAAIEVGFRAGVGIPVLANGEVLVVAFFMFESGEEDHHLMEIVSAVARQLGSVLQRKRVEDKLQITQFSVDKAADAIFWIDTEARIRYANNATTDMFGYSHDELLAMTLFDLEPDYRERWLKYWGNLRWKKSLLFESNPRRKDGTTLPVEILSNYLQFKGQEINVAFVRDVTERKRAEESLRENQHFIARIAAANPNMLYVYDLTETRTVYASRDYGSMLGYTAAEIEKMGASSALYLMHPDDLKQYPQWIGRYDSLDDSEVLETEYRLKHANGSYRWFLSRSMIFERAADGKPRQIIGVAQDSTERKQREREREAIATLSIALRFAMTRDEIMKIILDQTVELLHMDGAAMVMRDVSAGDAVVEYATTNWASYIGSRIPAGQGVSGYVIASGQPYLNNDLMSDDRLHDSHRYNFKAAMCAPLIAQGATIGALWTGRSLAISESEMHVLTAVGDIAANAIHRLTIHEQTQRRADEFAALYDTMRDLAAQHDVNILLETIVERAMKLMAVGSCTIRLYDSLQNDLVMVVVKGIQLQVGARLALGEGLGGRAAQSRQPLIVNDYQTWEHRLPEFKALSIRASMQVPMIFGGELIGVLGLSEVGDSTRKFSDEDARLLSLFASQAASAVHGARLFEEMRHRAAELEAINKVSTALRAAQTLNEMLPLLLDETLTVLGTTTGIIRLYDPASDELRKAAARGWLDQITTDLKSGEGIGGHVYTMGEAYLSREFVTDPLFHAPMRFAVESGWGGACVPIRTAREIVGVLFVAVELPREITSSEVRLLTTVAEIAGNAIYRMRLFEQTERRLEHLQAMRAIDTAITSSFDLRVTLAMLLDQVTAQLGVDAAAVLLHNPQTGMLSYFAGHGFRSRVIEQTRLRLGEGLAGEAIFNKRVITANLPDAKFARAQLLAGEKFVAYCVVPFIIKGQPRGVLEIFSCAPLNLDQELLDFLETLGGQAAVAIDNAELFNGLQRSNVELALAYDATIEGWSQAMDLRDKETEGHSQRVTEAALRLAQAMGLQGDDWVQMRRGALLHDIGKMGVPDSILLKNGPLTDEEWVIMRKHPEHAYTMLKGIGYLHRALDIPYCHHEKWDGTGYPRGLKGEEIPLVARIFAVIDVWDALSSDRPYRKGWTEEKVQAFIREQAGKHFDPKVVEAFLRLMGLEGEVQ